MEDYRSIWMHLHATTFRQAWVDAGGVSTRYCEAVPPAGVEPRGVVIMLHGTGGSWEAFCAAIAEHSKAYRCLALDLLGNGFTDKPDHDYEIKDYVRHVLAFMDAMGIARASFIGVSMGAWISCQLALDHPDRVQSITLVAASGMMSAAESMNVTKTTRGKAVDNPTWENVKPIFNSLIYDEKNRIADLVAIRQAAYRQESMKQAMGHILCLQDVEIRQRNLIPEADWKRIGVPALIFAAPHDRKDFYETAKRASELMPNAVCVEVTEVKHWVQFERPDIFNPVNLAFLAGEPANEIVALAQQAPGGAAQP